MKSSLSLLSLAALAAVVLTAGCDTAPTREPRTTRTIVLAANRPSPEVEMGLVSALRLILPGPDAGSGLVWEVVSNNTKVLEQMGPLKPAAALEGPGSGPSTVASFYSLKPGRSELQFVLVNMGAAEAVPVAKCQLVVRVVD